MSREDIEMDLALQHFAAPGDREHRPRKHWWERMAAAEHCLRALRRSSLSSYNASTRRPSGQNMGGYENG